MFEILWSDNLKDLAKFTASWLLYAFTFQSEDRGALISDLSVVSSHTFEIISKHYCYIVPSGSFNF
jgi:hypothetical protein